MPRFVYFALGGASLFGVRPLTGNNTAGATIAHGLGTTPNALIIKNRTDGGSSNWAVWHDKSFVSASEISTCIYK